MKAWSVFAVLAVGAVLGNCTVKTKSFVSRCLVGDPAQDAADVSKMFPAMIRAIRRADVPRPSADLLAAEVAYAWVHLQRCAAERGLEKCRAIGTRADVPIEDLGARVQDFPESEWENYIYRIEADVPGPRFFMNFLLQGLDDNDETFIDMTFFRKDTTAKLRVGVTWYRCRGTVNWTTVRGSVYEEVASPAR